jgi:RNA polymerase sigma-32 factor
MTGLVSLASTGDLLSVRSSDVVNLGNVSISRYIAFVQSIPMLSAEDETRLIGEFLEKQDPKAANAIVLAHLRLVVKIAFDFKKYHSSLKDLISEGNLGLVKALNGFLPEKGVRFATYAMLWVKASIQDFVLRTRSSVRVGTTNAQRKIAFHLGKVKKFLGITDNAQVLSRVDEVADQLGVTSEDLSDYLCATSEVSLDTAMASDDDSGYGLQIAADRGLEPDFDANCDLQSSNISESFKVVN